MTDLCRRPRRRQYSVRTLLIAVFVLSLPFSWFAVQQNKARQQKAAIAAVKERGGKIRYDYEFEYFERLLSQPPTSGLSRPVRPWPRWLYGFLGDDVLHSVSEVSLSPGYPEAWQNNWSFSDRDLDLLDEFTKLRAVNLSFQPFTDAGLRKLASFRNLRRIDLAGTRVTDEGLQLLAGLRELRWLDVGNTKVTIPGIARLGNKVPSLKEVRVTCSQAESGFVGREEEMRRALGRLTIRLTDYEGLRSTRCSVRNASESVESPELRLFLDDHKTGPDARKPSRTPRLHQRWSE